MLIGFHHIESLAKYEIPHNVVTDIGAPIGHVLLWRPFPRFSPFCEMFTPCTDIVEDERLGRTDGAGGECVVKYTSFECMSFAIYLAMCAHCSRARGHGHVPFCLLNVGLSVAVDLFQCWDCVDRDGVGPDSDNGACLTISASSCASLAWREKLTISFMFPQLIKVAVACCCLINSGPV
jgi:hypothetical protein